MLQVTSEVGRLRKVLVHEPGAEVDRMVPAMMEQLLFDDILYGDRARDEHGQFRRVLQLAGVEVVEASDLLCEVLEQEAARRWVVEVLCSDLATAERASLEELTSERLAELLVAGAPAAAPPAGVEVEDLYRVPPLPNWCFQRDPQVVLGDGVIFSAMAQAARHREGLLARLLFRFHPELARVPVLFDPLATPPGAGLPLELERPCLEGGDLLVVSPEVAVVGLSERTNRIAVKHLARALARRAGAPRWLVIAAVPRRRAYMHLDTLITPVDRDACLVYPPVVLGSGTEHAEVFEIDLHSNDLAFAHRGRLLETLAAHGADLEPIPCGGDDAVAQQREQWTDGANALAVAPGLILLYNRNLLTAEALDARGFRIVNSEDLLLGRDEVDVEDGGRVCVLLESHEISRARGGPHCLAHPLVRDAV
jgi:arginine deiminase